jgi:hypothetical protein
MIQLQTNSLINIYKALAAFQQDCPVIHKGSNGHNYTYADFPTILEVINPLLKKHNLGFTQLLIEDGLKTIIFHTLSAESIESKATIPQITLRGMNEYQSFGSGITYYRRYALSAALGLVTDKDTDASGEKAASVFIKKHRSILDLTLAIDMCESIKELQHLHTLNAHLLNEGIMALFTSKKSRL